MKYWTALIHRRRRERLDVGYHVNDGRAFRRECLRQRRWELTCSLDPNSKGPDAFGEIREIRFIEGPQFARLFGRSAAVGAVETALRLVAAAIIVDDRDGVDIPANCRFDLGDVIPEPGIAGERHDRAIRTGTLRTEPCRKCPAEMAGAAQVPLIWALEIVHPAHPHSGVTGVDDNDGVVGRMLGELVAQPLWPDRNWIGCQGGLVFFPPV